MDSDMSYDLIFKTVIIGDSGVGKSNLFTRFMYNEYNSSSKSTIGVEFGAKRLIFGDKIVKAQIWDTAGQERYKSIISAYYRGARGALLVFDITNLDSFRNVDRWLSELRNNGDSDIVIVLVGNKSDKIDSRQVNEDLAVSKAAELGIAYVETSALEGTNVDIAFDKMCSVVFKKMMDNLGTPNETELIEEKHTKLINDAKEKRSECNC